MILGITGGTGCGKTTLLNVLKERGAVVLDCDAIYHELLTRDASLLAAIEERFPGTVEDGVLQRKKLGNLVFSDKNALLDLNRITHAAVKREVLRRLGEKPALAAIDAIALFEGGLAGLCDVTVAVTAPVEDRVRRLMRRDGIPEDYARRRIEAQKPDEFYRASCGAVLEKALGHDYKSEVTAPTCTEMGYTTNTCSRCGDTNKSNYTEPAGHKPSDWIVDKQPTTDSDGSKHKECTECGEKLETQPIEKIYNSATTDSKGEAIVGGYLVIVTDTDTKNPVANAAVALHKDNSISIRLPNSRLLDYADQTTVTVQLVKDKSAVPGMSIAVTDKNDNYASGKTDKTGQITVPTGSGKTNEDGKVTTGHEDADGDRWTLTVKVIRTDTKRPISGSEVSIGKTGNITVKLPDGTDLDKNHRVTVTVTDHKKNPQENKNIIVKGDLSQTAKGKTDQDGKLTVPEIEERERHGTYILGYTDGTFGPSRSMTRAEAAAIFARLLAEKNGDTISTVANTRFTDIPAHAWYSGYAKYLNNNGVTYGKSKTIFAPNDAITRAEFTTLAVRFFDVYGDGDAEIMEQYKDFNDVSDGYWAAAYIKAAAKHGWINGYGDGSFRADDEINRAEVVTIVNRLLGREADEAYVADNLRKLNTFSDMSKRHWAYYAVMEAANAHTAILGDSESWSK